MYIDDPIETTNVTDEDLPALMNVVRAVMLDRFREGLARDSVC